MACAALLASPSPAAPPPLRRGKGRDAVYVAAVPLRASPGPAQMLMTAAYSAGSWDLQHFMVLIKPAHPLLSEALVFDFQPQNPENVLVAIAALSLREVPGNFHNCVELNWDPAATGKFTTKDWKNRNGNCSGIDDIDNLNRIWHVLILTKYSVTIWGILCNGMPTDDTYQKIGIPTASRCNCCINYKCEGLVHLMIESDIAKCIWNHYALVFGTPIHSTSIKHLLDIWLDGGNRNYSEEEASKTSKKQVLVCWIF